MLLLFVCKWWVLEGHMVAHDGLSDGPHDADGRDVCLGIRLPDEFAEWVHLFLSSFMLTYSLHSTGQELNIEQT